MFFVRKFNNQIIINTMLIITGILSLSFILNTVNYILMIILKLGVLIGSELRWLFEL